VSRITAVVLDKTGTLTEGRPSLRHIVVLDGDESEILAVAAAAEANSEHPLARAIVEGAHERGVHVPVSESFRSITGKGIEAVVRQRKVLVGNALLLEASGIDTQNVAVEAGELRRDGATVMYVSIDGRLAGLIAVADPVKASAVQTVRDLHALGLKVIMLTGDNATTAGAIAQRIGIDHVEADVLPADKERHVAALQAQGHVVAMVGDGVNDAPALARADIGIAIGAGTDVAVQTARVVLMRSDPADIQKAIRLSKATVRKMKQNLFWASIYNVLAIPVAAGVLYYPLGIELRPEWAALLMSFSSIIVAVNAVTLRRAKL
jgi:Cu2+-exporting ATPase